MRPIRFAFMVPYNDTEALLAAIQVNSFLWGGQYNPILPVFQRVPPHYPNYIKSRIRKNGHFKDFVDVYRPDFIVKPTGNTEIDETIENIPVIARSDVWIGFDTWRTPHYGLGLFEILNHFVNNEYKFVARHIKKLTIPILSGKFAPFLATVFGQWPTAVQEIFDNKFAGFFDAEKHACSIETFAGILGHNYVFPRRLSSYGIDNRTHDQCLLFLDASRFLDIIEYWNLRALGIDVVPIPRQAVDSIELNGFVKTVIEQNYDPSKGYAGTIVAYDTSSIDTLGREPFEYFEKIGIPSQQPITDDKPNPNKVRFSYLPFVGEESFHRNFRPRWQGPLIREASYSFSDSNFAQIKLPTSDFAQSSIKAARYAYDIALTVHHHAELMAQVLPKGDSVMSLSLGGYDFTRFRFRGDEFTYLSYSEDETLQLQLPRAEDVLTRWFQNSKYNLAISPAGRIARQTVKSLGGLHGTWLLSDERMFDLLNNGFRKGPSGRLDGMHSDARPLRYEVLIGKLHEIANKRQSIFRRTGHDFLAELLRANVIQLGLTVSCSFCHQPSWFPVDHLAYHINCPNCLETYDFPSALPQKELTWSYRSIGGFSAATTNYGSYCVLLALRFFAITLNGETTPFFGPEIWLKDEQPISENKIETDLMLFYRQRLAFEESARLLFVECKTYNKCFMEKDFKNLEIMYSRFPASYLVFATLEKSLSDDEVQQLRSLNKTMLGRSARPGTVTRLIILTGAELYSTKEPPHCWEGKLDPLPGDWYVKVLGGNLKGLAEISQKLYLDNDH